MKNSTSTEIPQFFDYSKSQLLEKSASIDDFDTFILDQATQELGERIFPIIREFDEVFDIGTPFAAFGKKIAEIRNITKLTHFSNIPSSSEKISNIPIVHESLSLPDLELQQESASLIVSGMLLHRINDLPGTLIQFHKALKPGGLMIAAFPGGDTLTELRSSLLQAEGELRGAAGLRIFPMTEIKSAGNLLQRAGFKMPIVDYDKITVRYSDIFGLLQDLRKIGASASIMKRQGQPSLTPDILSRAQEIYEEKYSDDDGKIRATFDMLWLLGWA